MRGNSYNKKVQFREVSQKWQKNDCIKAKKGQKKALFGDQKKRDKIDVYQGGGCGAGRPGGWNANFVPPPIGKQHAAREIDVVEMAAPRALVRDPRSAAELLITITATAVDPQLQQTRSDRTREFNSGRSSNSLDGYLLTTPDNTAKK